MLSSVISAHEAMASHIKRRYQARDVQTRNSFNLNCRTSRTRCFQRMCARLSLSVSNRTLTKRVRDCQRWLASNGQRKSNNALKQRKPETKVQHTSTT